jgi:hypothetical protein
MDVMVDHVSNLYEKAKEYVEASIEIYKLQAINTSADVVSTLAHKAILILIISTFIIFFNVAMALLIGDMLSSYFKGFLVVSLFYLIAALVVHFFNVTLIKKPVSNIIISKMMDSKTKQQKIAEVIDNAQKENDEYGNR